MRLDRLRQLPSDQIAGARGRHATARPPEDDIRLAEDVARRQRARRRARQPVRVAGAALARGGADPGLAQAQLERPDRLDEAAAS